MTKMLPVISLGIAMAAGGWAQMAISAKSGLVAHVEGRVLLGEQEVVLKSGGRLTEMKPEQSLKTEEGRAEVLLTPGVIVRLGENSSIKMIANRLEDTRVEITGGSVVVEATEIAKEHAVTLLVGQASVGLRKMALLTLDAQTGVKVYKGEAQVIAGGSMQILREGRQMEATGTFAMTKFDKNETDALYRWANRRSEMLAMANIASAKSAQRNGGMGMGYMQGGWMYNPYFGMFTYLPLSGMLRSPFGFVYYSPGLVNRYYNQYIQAALPVQSQGFGGGGMNSGPRFDQNLGYTVNSRAGMNAPSGGAPMGGSAGVGGGGAPAAAPAPSRGDAGGGGVRGGGGGGSAH
jgi:hypothetical protein